MANDTLWDNYADARLKEEVTNLTNCLAKIAALQPQSYRLTSSPSELRVGYTAQEFVLQFPELTYYNVGVDNGTDPISPNNFPWLIDVGTLIPHITGAIKELKEQVEALQLRISNNS